MELPTAVYVIWIVVLIVAYLSVPLLLYALTRIVVAARKIKLYAEETHGASSAIGADLGNVVALNETESLLTVAHSVGDEIAEEAETIVKVLVQRLEGAR